MDPDSHIRRNLGAILRAGTVLRCRSRWEIDSAVPVAEPFGMNLSRCLWGLCLMVIGSAMTGPVHAQTAGSLAESLLAETGSPGVGVALYDGQVTDIAVAGERAKGSGVAVAPDDKWHMGSNGKALTALLIARLTEQGRIGRDDTLGATLGPVLPELHTGYADVTYDQLLAHRAGIRANPGLRDLLAYAGDRTDPALDRREIVAKLLRQPPRSAPGTQFLYSNAGYMTAGVMLEDATGRTWRALMQDEVFTPMGLGSAGFGAPGTPEAVDQPRGHKRGLMGLLPLRPVPPGPGADNIAALGPAGTMHMSLDDHMRVLRAHLARNTDVLSSDGWNRLHVPAPGVDYVGGWLIHAGIHLHNGSNTMWFNTAAMDLNSGRAIIIAFNAATPKVRALSQETALRWLDAQ